MKCWYLIFVFIFQLTFDIYSPEGQNRFSIPYTNDALIFYGVNNGYAEKYKVDPQILKHNSNNPSVNTRTIFDPNQCKDTLPISCDLTSPYRNIDGTCNNLNHPTWGSVECYLRVQPASYEGYDGFRSSTTGGPLPEPRDITLNIFQHANRPSKASFMFTYYGQTLAHDLSRAILTNTDLFCCTPKNEKNPACIVIHVRKDDPFFSTYNKTCLLLHRTEPCSSCNVEKREQKNGVTTTLDSSQIYGSEEETASKIRAKDGTGKLIFRRTEHGDLLPIDKDPIKVFCPVQIQLNCLKSGDVRLNQHSALSSLQTIYMREHNRIATILKKMNPHWEEERLYQETRRLNIAQLQCITYREYLPQLLGSNVMKQFNLTVDNSTQGTKYDDNLRLGVWNEFANAAFRLHSMIASDIGALHLRFRDILLNPGLLQDGFMDDIIRGGCQVPSEKNDHWHIPDTKQSIRHDPGSIDGTDLISIDIQRARDHGMPPYTEMVKYCSNGQIVISSFKDLSPLLMKQENVKFLEDNFKTVEDIDLYVGLQMERLYPESEVGPTTSCIITKQFYFFKFADRFYFEHEGEVPSFSPAQRNSLKQCSFARMLCDNTNITQIQTNVMILSNDKNPIVPCKEIPAIDITLWKERIPA